MQTFDILLGFGIVSSRLRVSPGGVDQLGDGSVQLDDSHLQLGHVSRIVDVFNFVLPRLHHSFRSFRDVPCENTTTLMLLINHLLLFLLTNYLFG